MAGTQFIGKGPMLAAYSEVGDELPWALFQGKKPRQTGEGSADLEKWLDIFSPAGSTAVYTLCVYPEDVDPGSITASTQCLVCWDFKLNEYRGGEGAVSGIQKKIEDKVAGMVMERLDKIEKKMDDGADDPDEGGFDLNKVIMGWLQNPEQLVPVIGAIKSLWNRGAGAAVMAPAVIGAVAPQAEQKNEEDIYNRLSKVLDRLQVDNPKLLDQLEKLADIKEKKPDTFKFLISNLNGL